MNAASRKWLLVLLVTVFTVVACSSIAPLRTLKKLRDALQARDETTVAALVDFSRVKASSQLRTEARLKQANEGRPLGGLRAAIADRFADRVIDKIATPRGLIGMVCDGSLKAPPSPPPPCALKGEVSDHHAESDSRYVATLALPDGKKITLTVEQQPDSAWRVVDIEMSPESFEQLRQSITD
ncbi:MAG: hypothetical protein JWQ90_390 [Hydrocarboniphaga sp.]|uniref:DUF2939 domain-containing protein n=1 Tax=Hydrocarboniphaga sp. TaxID=2033016 RepID=UPI002636E175|nr:DUF2939 domain-containing protein [Hydrocarboniphaga sp.]MDB5967940.1 hypothetical protein [Hydrocarboniphaga sp.]